MPSHKMSSQRELIRQSGDVRLEEQELHLYLGYIRLQDERRLLQDERRLLQVERRLLLDERLLLQDDPSLKIRHRNTQWRSDTYRFCRLSYCRLSECRFRICRLG